MKPRIHSVRRARGLPGRTVRWTHVFAATFGVALGALCGLAGFLAFRGQRSVATEAPFTQAPANTARRHNGDKARRHRRAGLDALSAEDFPEAARQFALALQSPHPPSDAAELLGLTKSLENAKIGKSRREEESDDTEPKVGPAGATLNRRVPEDAPTRVVHPVRVPPQSGLISVTTTPPGLIIQVDGEVRDLSPARIRVVPGPHQIAILNGADRRPLIRRQVNVTRGQLARLTEDVRRLISSRSSEENRENPPRATAPSGTTSSPSFISSPHARGPPPPPSSSAAPPQFRPPPARLPPPPFKGIPRPTVREVLKRVMPRLRKCYERELASNPELTGQVIARVAIQADGAVEDVRGEEIRLASGIAVACIFRTLRQLRFPAPQGGPVRITIPLVFEPESMTDS